MGILIQIIEDAFIQVLNWGFLNTPYISKHIIINILMGIANCKSVNPKAAKASILVTKYPKRQIFPRKNNSNVYFPMLKIA